MMTKQKLSVRDICLIGVFTAIISVLSQVRVPMPYGVPMTLQTFVIPLAGVVLGRKNGALSALTYVLLGSLGVPVFTGFTGGVGIVFGPTGGFILSFPIMALMAGIGAEKKNNMWLMFGIITGAVFSFLCGTLMFSLITSSSLRASFVACVLPFIPMEAIKAIMAGVLGLKIKSALNRGKVLV